jgi:integrase
MPRPSSSDKKYLELNHGKWRVTIAVPRPLQAKLGTRLKRELKTDSIAIANQLKWQVIGELKAEIEHARMGQGTAPVRGESLMQEALVIAAQRNRSQSHDEDQLLEYAVNLRREELRGEPVRTTQDEGQDAEPVYHPHRLATAEAYRSLAMGEATPIGLHHGQFITQGGLKPRTQGDDLRAVKFLLAWCREKRVPATLEAITRKVAVRFLDDLPRVAGGQTNTTLKKYVLRLSRYWQWLQGREIVDADVWAKLKLPAVAKGPEERSFTDAEVARLLAGQTTQQMHDLMRLAALTGARLDVIVDLKVRDCEGGLITFKPQKKEPKPRSVPIHPALVEIIGRRCDGKGPEDSVFPEWPAPQANSLRERSFKASNAFTTYRRKVGVDEVIAGKRRSLVNFHSFRRWFITKAEQADQSGNIIAAVVGHKRQGITLGRYSAGPLVEQARRCVEAVKLPLCVPEPY